MIILLGKIKQMITIEGYNALVRKLSEQGYTVRTQQAILSTIYGSIVIPPELSRGGEVMTYEEAARFFEARTKRPRSEYTRAFYDQEVRDLFAELGDEVTYEGFLAEKRRQYQRSIDEAFGEGYMDIDEYSTEYLREILNEAWRLAKEDPDGSSSFAAYLNQILMEE